MTFKEKAIIFDCDGVLLDTEFIFREILELNLKGDARWNYFIDNCNSDKVKPITNSTKFFFRFIQAGFHIFISTARNEKCKEETLNKLWKEGFIIPEDNLYMRKDGDYRVSQEVKKDHLIEISKNYDIIAFIDDELANCEMAKDFGILALRKV